MVAFTDLTQERLRVMMEINLVSVFAPLEFMNELAQFEISSAE